MELKAASKRTEKPGDTEANAEETWTWLHECEADVKNLRAKL